MASPVHPDGRAVTSGVAFPCGLALRAQGGEEGNTPCLVPWAATLAPGWPPFHGQNLLCHYLEEALLGRGRCSWGLRPE